MTPNTQVTKEKQVNWTSSKDLHITGYYQESEKTIHRMGGNICKPHME